MTKVFPTRTVVLRKKQMTVSTTEKKGFGFLKETKYQGVGGLWFCAESLLAR